MTGTLRRLLALTGAPRRRVALAAVLGVAGVCFGAGLMATAGYLIVRAAEQPPVLALTTAIVAVRFFGLARPLARYLERLAEPRRRTPRARARAQRAYTSRSSRWRRRGSRPTPTATCSRAPWPTWTRCRISIRAC